MKTIINNQKGYVIPAIITLVVVIFVGAYLLSRSKAADNAADSGKNTSASSTDQISYSLMTSKTSYGSNEKIPIIILISNNSGSTKRFNFKDGCQASYKIGDFDIAQHIRCLPEPSSFTVKPGESKQIGITHYPSVYKLPVGNYTLTASVIGYGEVKAPIKIAGAY